MQKTCGIYVVNYKDDERRNKMTYRLKSVGMDAHFVDPVHTSDPRIKNQPITDFEKRTWSIFFQHIDCVRQFYENTTYDYAIICEDDVLISRTLSTDIPQIIDLFDKSQLDIMLLSYLWPFEIPTNNYFPVINEEHNGFTIHGYPDDLWGGHMYMISRQHAKMIIERYTPEFALSLPDENPFAIDWQLTKFGRRGLIVPMLGVEEGEVKTDHQGQIDFHRTCFQFNYNPDKHI